MVRACVRVCVCMRACVHVCVRYSPMKRVGRGLYVQNAKLIKLALLNFICNDIAEKI